MIDTGLDRAIRDALAQPKPNGAQLQPRPRQRIYRREAPEPLALDPTKIRDLFPLVRSPQPDPWLPRGPVTVEGQLTPAISGAIIAMEVKQGEESRIDFVKTDTNGNYRFITTDNLSGRVVVQAFFDGDKTHGKSESGICAFNVK